MLVARCKLERRQAIIQIGIQPFPLVIPAVGPQGNAPRIPVNSYRALIDTGAQRTCLTRETIIRERLVRHGHRFIKNVHGEETHSTYMTVAGIFAEDGINSSLHNPVKSYFGVEEPIEIINIADNKNFDAILGMDLLERFSFKFDKSGDFEILLT